MSEPQASRLELPFTRPTFALLHSPAAHERAPLVVALHGQGMSAATMIRLCRLETTHRHLLVPDAPLAFEKRSDKGITIGHGWYLYTGDQAHFRAELERAEALVLAWIARAKAERGIDPARVTLLGYSQGGYLAGFVALRNPKLIRGAILISTRFKHEFLATELESKPLPAVFVIHSEADRAISWRAAEASVDVLRRAGADVTIALHDEGHRLPTDLATRVEGWLDARDL